MKQGIRNNAPTQLECGRPGCSKVEWSRCVEVYRTLGRSRLLRPGTGALQRECGTRTALIVLVLSLFSAGAAVEGLPPVIAPPESFFQIVSERDREVARTFYQKYIDVNGMPVVAAGVVDDRALQRTHEIVTRMLAGRPDIVTALVKNRMYLIVMGKDQVYTDMPEYRNHPDPAFQNERVRGTGGRPTSFGEENVLSLPIDRYDDESIGVHEFCHTIDGALRSIDPTWTERKNKAYRNALQKGLWKLSYAAGNAGEYWAEICQSYFDCNRVNNWNHGPIGAREQLKVYDPEGYELVRTTFKLSPEQDWRYRPLQMLPNVTHPPARFHIDSYYTRFTWAREFSVIGRGASDEALLKANDTIRKLFAYRHDILKALIADGVKLVVLGRGEKISDLPEYGSFKELKGFDPLARTLDYAPESKLLVVAEENVLADPQDGNVGGNQVIRVFANALYGVTAGRPVDPNWEKRGRAVQQYELRVERLDVRFDEKLKELFEKAASAGKWKGTAAIHDRTAYWTAGVLAYFDAAGQDAAPNDASHPINTREALREYDAGLFALVHETMAYEGRVDWRFHP
jgi:alpha-glucosidase